jgi:RHS repeat-associated protein
VTPHFTGKERDTESGNDYFGARYYASSMGRFLSPDPGWFSAADSSDPQSWNLYSYARNNPMINIDPAGYDCVYLNATGTDVDRDKDGNVTGIDRNSSKGECMGDARTMELEAIGLMGLLIMALCTRIAMMCG